MNVLFIAFEFPPLAVGGVYRPLAFVKYLPEFGLRPVVVTTDEQSYRQVIVDPPLDASLLAHIPGDAIVHRVPCPRPKPLPKTRFGEWRRIFFSLVEEGPRFWEPHLMASVERIARQHQVEAIYATAPPFYVATLACRIARRLSLPLVMDFRDAWSQWRMGPYGTWLHYWLTHRRERECLLSADRVVTTSQQTRRDFLRVHPQVPPEKIAVITNGYDRDISDWSLSPPIGKDAFHRVPVLAGREGRGGTRPYHPEENDGAGAVAMGSRAAPGRPFVIGYVGTFYYSPAARAAMMRPWWRKKPNRMIQYSPRKEDWLYRSPWFFFQAVGRLLAHHPEYRPRLRLRFAGQKPDWMDAQVNQFGLAGNVEFLGLLDHAGALRFQEDCDALLVTSSKVIGGADYSIAGKTFEYFSMRKPIVGFVAEGAQKDLLAESGLAVICDPDNPADSARQLDQLISGQLRLEPNVPFLKTLHRRELTRKLADLLREAVEHHQPQMNTDAHR
jgi:glycosyltransferase involved in cell wall biosynthesis